MKTYTIYSNNNGLIIIQYEAYDCDIPVPVNSNFAQNIYKDKSEN